VTFGAMKPSATLRALLGEAIDYAGLFPPAKLAMSDAVRRYAEYLDSDAAWALGRFVVPAERLEEFAVARRSIGGDRQWRLSAVLGADALQGCADIRRHDQVRATESCVDSVEFKIAAPPPLPEDQIGAIIRSVPNSVRAFAEVPLDSTTVALLDTTRAAQVSAKVRTGGVTAEAFPAPAEVASFLIACAKRDLSFKATAGLHHPCRGIYPLTYDAASPKAMMFGFLNVLIAATLARVGKDRESIITVLQVDDVGEFWFGSEEIRWRDARISRAEVKDTRTDFALSFGSCSFEEPIEALRSLSLL
jgi:hypothetical protein